MLPAAATDKLPSIRDMLALAVRWCQSIAPSVVVAPNQMVIANQTRLHRQPGWPHTAHSDLEPTIAVVREWRSEQHQAGKPE